jgi:hypothetical protein
MKRSDKTMLNDYRDILTVEDVQDILGIGKNAVYQLCREHSLECFRINRKWIIPKISLCEYIEKQRKAQPAYLVYR